MLSINILGTYNGYNPNLVGVLGTYDPYVWLYSFTTILSFACKNTLTLTLGLSVLITYSIPRNNCLVTVTPLVILCRYTNTPS